MRLYLMGRVRGCVSRLMGRGRNSDCESFIVLFPRASWHRLLSAVPLSSSFEGPVLPQKNSNYLAELAATGRSGESK